MTLKSEAFLLKKGESLDRISNVIQSLIGLDAFLIKGLKATALNDSVTQLTVIYDQYPSNLLDFMSPKDGIILSTDITSGKFSARILFSTPIDPNTVTGTIFYIDDIPYSADAVVVESNANNYILNLDLSIANATQDVQEGAFGEGLHTLKLDTTNIKRADGSSLPYWAVGGYVINQLASPSTGDLPGSVKPRGIVKFDRLRIGKSNSPKRSIQEFLSQRSIAEDRLLFYESAPAGDGLIDIFFVYLHKLEPQIIDYFPHNHSLFPLANPPSKVSFLFNDRLDRSHLLSNNGLFTFDFGFGLSFPIAFTDITLLSGDRLVEIDISDYFVDQALSQAGSYSVIARPGIKNREGVFKQKPEIWTYNLSQYTVSQGLTGTLSGSQIQSGFFVRSIDVTGSGHYDHVAFEGLGSVNLTSVGNTIYFSGVASTGNIGASEFIDLSGYIQNQINTLDTSIDNLDNTYATDLEVNVLSGFLQTGLDSKASSLHSHTFDQLSNVDVGTQAVGDLVQYDGSEWVNVPLTDISHNSLGDLTAGNPHTQYALVTSVTGISGYLHTVIDNLDYLPTDTIVLLSGHLQTQVNNTSSLVVTTSGHLQNQLDSIDYMPTDTILSFSGHLQTQINNLDTGYVTELEISVLSGYIQTGLDNKASISHTHPIGDLSDVNLTSQSSNDLLQYDGSEWVNIPLVDISHNSLGDLTAGHPHTQYTLHTSFTGVSGYLYDLISAIDYMPTDAITAMSGHLVSVITSTSGHIQNQLDTLDYVPADSIATLSGYLYSSFVFATGLVVSTSGHLQTQINAINYLPTDSILSLSGHLQSQVNTLSIATGYLNTQLANYQSAFVNASGHLQSQLNAQDLDDHTDVNLDSPTTNDLLSYQGSEWTNIPLVDISHNSLGDLTAGDPHTQYTLKTLFTGVSGYLYDLISAIDYMPSDTIISISGHVTSIIASTSGHLQTQIDTLDYVPSDTIATLSGFLYNNFVVATGLVVSTSGYLQGQLDSIDYLPTDTILSLSGHLQTQIDNLDTGYVTELEISVLSGYIQTGLDNKSNVSHTHTFNSLSDVTLTSQTTDDLLQYDGSEWVNVPLVDISHSSLGDLTAGDPHTQYVLGTLFTGVSGYLYSLISAIDYMPADTVVLISGHLQGQVNNLATATGYLQDQIDVLTSVSYVYQSEFITFSGYVQGELDDLISATGVLQDQIDALTYASPGDLLSVSGHLQDQIDTLDYMPIDTVVSMSGHLQSQVNTLSIATGNIQDQLNVLNSGDYVYNTEFVNASGHLQTQINSQSLTDHLDVNLTSPTTDDILSYQGGEWTNIPLIDVSHADLGDLTAGDPHTQYALKTLLTSTSGYIYTAFTSASGAIQAQVNSLITATGYLHAQINAIDYLPADSILSFSGHLQSQIVSTTGLLASTSGHLQSQINSKTLDSLVDVSLTSPANNDLLQYDGSEWVNINIGDIAHSDLDDLGADDHPQYFLADGSRQISGKVTSSSLNNVLHNFTILPGGGASNHTSLKLDQNYIAFINRWPTAGYVNAPTLSADNIDRLFSQQDSYVNISGAGDPLVIEVTGLSLSSTTNHTAFYPYLLMHTARTMGLIMEVDKTGAWDVLYSGYENQSFQIAQVSSAGASLKGVRWTITGYQAYGNVYVKELGCIAAHGPGWIQTVRKQGDVIYGDLNFRYGGSPKISGADLNTPGGLLKIDATGGATFTGPVVGVTPVNTNHLATKGYIDSEIQTVEDTIAALDYVGPTEFINASGHLQSQLNSQTLDDHFDVNLSSPTTDDILSYQGGEWTNIPLTDISHADLGDLTAGDPHTQYTLKTLLASTSGHLQSIGESTYRFFTHSSSNLGHLTTVSNAAYGHVGGAYITGAIQIKFPDEIRFNNMMLSFDVDIQQYHNESGLARYTIYGYTYTGSSSNPPPLTGYWANPAVLAQGMTTGLRKPVYFGDISGIPTVWIGSTGDRWTYPDVKITNLTVRVRSGGENMFRALATGNWSVTFTTGEPQALWNVSTINPNSLLYGPKLDWKQLDGIPDYALKSLLTSTSGHLQTQVNSLNTTTGYLQDQIDALSYSTPGDLVAVSGHLQSQINSQALDDHVDVNISSATTNDILSYQGGEWTNIPLVDISHNSLGDLTAGDPHTQYFLKGDIISQFTDPEYPTLTGIGIFNSSAEDFARFSVGRSWDQAISIQVSDAFGKLILRQDETDTTPAYFDSIIESSSVGLRQFRWYLATLSGTSPSVIMTLTTGHLHTVGSVTTDGYITADGLVYKNTNQELASLLEVDDVSGYLQDQIDDIDYMPADTIVSLSGHIWNNIKVSGSNFNRVNGGAALNVNPELNDLNAWYNNDGTTAPLTSYSAYYSVQTATTDYDVTGGLYYIRHSGGPVASTNWRLQSELLPVDKTSNYRVSVLARQEGTGKSYLFVNFRDTAGNQIVDSWNFAGSRHYYHVNAPFTSDWTKYSANFGPDCDLQIPSNAVQMTIGALLSYNTTNTVIDLADYRLERLIGTGEVTPGIATIQALASVSGALYNQIDALDYLPSDTILSFSGHLQDQVDDLQTATGFIQDQIDALSYASPTHTHDASAITGGTWGFTETIVHASTFRSTSNGSTRPFLALQSGQSPYFLSVYNPNSSSYEGLIRVFTTPSGHIGIADRRLLTFNTHASAGFAEEGIDNILGGLGFYGPGLAHAQFSFRPSRGFECLNVGASAPSMTWPVDAAPYHDLRANRVYAYNGVTVTGTSTFSTAQGNYALHINNSNGYIGIHSSAPDAHLDIRSKFAKPGILLSGFNYDIATASTNALQFGQWDGGVFNEVFRFDTNRRFGIWEPAPAEVLHVSGNILASGDDNVYLKVKGYGTNSNVGIYLNNDVAAWELGVSGSDALIVRDRSFNVNREAIVRNGSHTIYDRGERPRIQLNHNGVSLNTTVSTNYDVVISGYVFIQNQAGEGDRGTRLGIGDYVEFGETYNSNAGYRSYNAKLTNTTITGNKNEFSPHYSPGYGIVEYSHITQGKLTYRLFDWGGIPDPQQIGVDDYTAITLDLLNKQLIVGTDSANHNLHVLGSGYVTDTFVVDNNLTVGKGVHNSTAVLHVYTNTSDTNTPTFRLEQAGAGDVIFTLNNAATTYSLGIDNAASDALKLTANDSLDTAGILHIKYNDPTPVIFYQTGQYKLGHDSTATDDTYINFGNGRGFIGYDGSAAELVIHAGADKNTSIKYAGSWSAGNDAIYISNTTTGVGINYTQAPNVAFGVQTRTNVDAIFVTHSNAHVGIGLKDPVSTLHVYENNSSNGSTVGVTVEQDGAGDALVQWLRTGFERYIAGIDGSDDAWKIQNGSALTSTPALKIDTDNTASFYYDVTFNNGVLVNGNATVTGDLLVYEKVGIGGVTPDSLLNLYISGSQNTTGAARIHLQNEGAGDSHITFEVGNGDQYWSIGCDNDANDMFRIHDGLGVFGGSPFSIRTDGGVGIGIDGTSSLVLRVKSDLDDSAFTVERSNGKVSVARDLSVGGHMSATTKAFEIKHQSKEGMGLRHACLEGPENGVYIRGKSTESTIFLPDYWQWLIDPESITVNITPIGKTDFAYYVESVSEIKVDVGGPTLKNYYYTIYAERKDVSKLEIEYYE